MPAARWRSQLSRRTTVLHRRGESPRRCGATLQRRADHIQRSTARARGKLACFVTYRETASAVALMFACHANAGCALEVTALTSHHGLAPKERGLPPVRCPLVVRRPIATTAARRARSKLACFATSRETATAVALACVPCECRLRVGGHSSHVAPRSCAEIERPFCRCGTLPWCVNRSRPAQHGARARRARMFCHLPRDSQHSGACTRAT